MLMPTQLPHALVVWPAHLRLSVLICHRGIMKERDNDRIMKCTISLALLYVLVWNRLIKSSLEPHEARTRKIPI